MRENARLEFDKKLGPEDIASPDVLLHECEVIASGESKDDIFDYLQQ